MRNAQVSKMDETAYRTGVDGEALARFGTSYSDLVSEDAYPSLDPGGVMLNSYRLQGRGAGEFIADFGRTHGLLSIEPGDGTSACNHKEQWNRVRAALLQFGADVTSGPRAAAWDIDHEGWPVTEIHGVPVTFRAAVPEDTRDRSHACDFSATASRPDGEISVIAGDIPEAAKAITRQLRHGMAFGTPPVQVSPEPEESAMSFGMGGGR